MIPSHDMEERWLQIPRLWPDRSDEHKKYSKYIYLAVADISAPFLCWLSYLREYPSGAGEGCSVVPLLPNMIWDLRGRRLSGRLHTLQEAQPLARGSGRLPLPFLLWWHAVCSVSRGVTGCLRSPPRRCFLLERRTSFSFPLGPLSSAPASFRCLVQ